MIADGADASDSRSSRSPATVSAIGMTVCLILLLLVQWQLFCTPKPGSPRLGGVFAQLLLRGKSPSEPNGWYQVSAPIAEAMMSSLPPDLRQRAEPVIEWLTGTDGIQRAEIVRMMRADGDLIVDLYGIDEIGCRRIMAATRGPERLIDLIAVASAASDVIFVPTTAAAEEQCDRKTAFMRMISRAPPSAHDQH